MDHSPEVGTTINTIGRAGERLGFRDRTRASAGLGLVVAAMASQHLGL